MVVVGIIEKNGKRASKELWDIHEAPPVEGSDGCAANLARANGGVDRAGRRGSSSPDFLGNSREHPGLGRTGVKVRSGACQQIGDLLSPGRDPAPEHRNVQGTVLHGFSIENWVPIMG
jgi:hypothetical protein